MKKGRDRSRPLCASHSKNRSLENAQVSPGISGTRILQRAPATSYGLPARAASQRCRPVRQARPTERVDRTLEDVKLLGRDGHLPWRVRNQAVDVCRSTTRCRRIVTRAAPIEERIDALPHELDFLLVLQRGDQRGSPFSACQRRQTTTCQTAAVNESSRRGGVAAAADQAFGPEQVVH